MRLESHISKRRDTWIWRMHKLNVERVLQEAGQLTEEDIQEEIIQKICGILDVNSFEVRPIELKNYVQNVSGEGNFLRGVYLQAALMAHDCVGNTHLAVDDDFCMFVHASTPIAEGDTIFFNYTNALLVSGGTVYYYVLGNRIGIFN